MLQYLTMLPINYQRSRMEEKYQHDSIYVPSREKKLTFKAINEDIEPVIRIVRNQCWRIEAIAWYV